MKLAIITHVPHCFSNDQYFAYGPYVREINIWIKNASEVTIVAPCQSTEPTIIDVAYVHDTISFQKVAAFNLLKFSDFIRSLLMLPGISISVFKAMRAADHIHLRCPGNIGLVGCVIQILFPRKRKTAKYAGNWDPNAKQPATYKLQKWILSNTFLTKNMQVLVYGEWAQSTKNIKTFFTASYSEADKLPVSERNLDGDISFVFVGTLAPGKRAFYAVQLVESLKRYGLPVNLSLYGNGKERDNIQRYIETNNLGSFIYLKGNQPQEVIKKAYQESHFVVLPSKSEGWPKVIAEGMFWGCLPIVTQVSCIPFMLNNEERGLYLEMDLEKDVVKIISLLENPAEYQSKVHKSVAWSRKYTLDLFADEIKALLNQ